MIKVNVTNLFKNVFQLRSGPCWVTFAYKPGVQSDWCTHCCFLEMKAHFSAMGVVQLVKELRLLMTSETTDNTLERCKKVVVPCTNIYRFSYECSQDCLSSGESRFEKCMTLLLTAEQVRIQGSSWNKMHTTVNCRPVRSVRGFVYKTCIFFG